MNKNQQRVLLGTAILIALMTLYPPFQVVTDAGLWGKGFDWIFSNTSSTVNIGLLLTQIFATLIVGGVLYLLLDKSNKK